MTGFMEYLRLVRSSLEFSKNVRERTVADDSKLADLRSQEQKIRKEISVFDAILGPIPPSALKRKPRPAHMLLSPAERIMAEVMLAGGTGSSQVIATRNNIEITKDKLLCLRDREWLNDEIINLYCDMLNDLGSGVGGKSKRTFVWNSFFWLKLSSDGKGYNYKAVQRWTSRRKIDLFSFDRILVPMNIGKNHWALGMVDLVDRTVQYYDSLAASTVHASFAEYIRQYLEDEFRDKRKDEECPDFASFETVLVEPPQQRNGYDCGVFTCMAAECLVAGRDWMDYDQSLIPDMRRKMAIQVQAGKIK